MKRGHLITFLAAAVWLWGGPAGAQVRVNLAEPLAGDTIPIDSGRIAIVIANRVRTRTYRVTIKRETLAIPALLPLPNALPKERAGGPQVPCDAVSAGTSAVSSSDDESRVARAVKELERLLGSGQCGDAAVTGSANAAIEDTRRLLDPIAVGSGEQLVLTIERLASDGASADKTWTVTLTTGARGEWLTTYGFAFVPNRDEQFFSKAAGANTFVITRERDAGGLSPTPSVFFSWVSRKASLRNVAVSPTAGLGLTSKLPSVFGGVSVLFNQNIGVAAGIGVYAQKRLSGRYAPGQQIAENLGEDQLHRFVYHPNWMVAATYRFGSNPFEKNGNTGATTAATPAATASGAAATQPRGRFERRTQR